MKAGAFAPGCGHSVHLPLRGQHWLGLGRVAQSPQFPVELRDQSGCASTNKAELYPRKVRTFPRTPSAGQVPASFTTHRLATRQTPR